MTFRWTFKDHYVSDDTFLYATGPVTSLKDENLNFYQTYRLERIANGKTKVLVKSRRVAPSNVGEASMPDYAALRDAAVTNAGPAAAGTSRSPARPRTRSSSTCASSTSSTAATSPRPATTPSPAST